MEAIDINSVLGFLVQYEHLDANTITLRLNIPQRRSGAIDNVLHPKIVGIEEQFDFITVS